MNKGQIQVGSVYRMKVAGKVTTVRIDGTHANGGWLGTDLRTGRTLRVRSAKLLRGKVN